MVQSLNTKVDLVIDATSFTGVSDYGKIMILCFDENREKLIKPF